MKPFHRLLCALGFAIGAGLLVVTATAQYSRHHMDRTGPMHMQMHPDTKFLFGAPAAPSDIWSIAKGGRLYDKWWVAIGRPAPHGSHPAYPKSGRQRGADTWRCKECHGWEYKGTSGKYATGSHATGIVGITQARGRKLDDIVKLLRGPTHRYSRAMIGDPAIQRLAVFVARGQHDTDDFIDPKTGKVSLKDMHRDNLLRRGTAIYQTTCAACHGFDGRALNFSDHGKPAFVGTEANKNSWEVLHKIRNSHPGAAMINLRAFPIRDAAAVLAHTRTLPIR